MVVLCLAACSRLANIEGTWNGAPVRYEQPTASGAVGSDGAVATNVFTQIATNMTFVPDAQKSGAGTVEFMSNVDVINTVPFDGKLVDPFEINIGATAVCTGTYHFEDQDDIVIAIDPASIKVDIDPQAVNYSENIATGQDAAQIDSLRPALVRQYTRQLLPVMKDYYSKITRIDDIKVKDGIMSCEINDRDLTFRRAQ
ncbi:MAG: hypothetical protein PUE10_03400 [Bacteroidales bacterium]|nr:hypothetical protein [Bacteroidales bacterium]